MNAIEAIYLTSGIVLPLFYAPQVAKIMADRTLLASYSLSKTAIQGVLRFPTLIFGIFVVNHALFTLIVSLDLIGRSIEFAAALWSLKHQGCSAAQILERISPLHRDTPGMVVIARSPTHQPPPDDPLVFNPVEH